MFKNNRKKYKITLNKRGEDSFQFFFEKELNIYWCLCLAPGYKKILKRVDEGDRFNSYVEWEKYIQSKYKDRNEDGLVEFSRYLNQRLRNLKPGRQANELYIPIALTLVVEKFAEVLLASTGIVSLFEAVKWGIFAMYALIILAFLCLFPVLWNIISPLWKDNLEENFIIDYKEVIDNMINKRK